GVGFRYTAVRVAGGFGVTGYVMNLSDGAVECVAEGARAELESFLEAVSEQMEAYVRTRKTTWEPATGEFDRFGVRLD
ncbi:acylphosphatase, partial [bacterium]|nr:acylphosphatase [bacterium]